MSRKGLELKIKVGVWQQTYGVKSHQPHEGMIVKNRGGN